MGTCATPMKFSMLPGKIDGIEAVAADVVELRAGLGLDEGAAAAGGVRRVVVDGVARYPRPPGVRLLGHRAASLKAPPVLAPRRR